MNEPPPTKIERLGDLLTNYGWDLIWGLAALVAGLLAARLFVRLLRKGLSHLQMRPAWRATVVSVVSVLLYAMVLTMAAGLIGFKSDNIFKLLIALTLAAIAVILIFRPYLPSLPFKVGNTVKSGQLFGKIEAITFMNTRMRTFDGKTVWIPNTKIFKDYLINYHYTPTRKIHLDVRIRYDQDLLLAKQTLEAIMIEDARVLVSPRPVVYVTHLLADCVAIGGRCWVDNLKYWRARCDLLEKIKLGFDREGIAFALPQRDVYLNYSENMQSRVVETGGPDDDSAEME